MPARGRADVQPLVQPFGSAQGRPRPLQAGPLSTIKPGSVGKPTEQYDDNVRQGGLIGGLHDVQGVIGRADPVFQAISGVAGKLSAVFGVAAGACGAAETRVGEIPIIGELVGACAAGAGAASVATLQVAVGADVLRAAGGHGNLGDLVLDSASESLYGMQRGVNAGLSAIEGLTQAARLGLKRMNDLINTLRSAPFLIPTFHNNASPS